MPLASCDADDDDAVTMLTMTKMTTMEILAMTTMTMAILVTKRTIWVTTMTTSSRYIVPLPARLRAPPSGAAEPGAVTLFVKPVTYAVFTCLSCG